MIPFANGFVADRDVGGWGPHHREAKRIRQRKRERGPGAQGTAAPQQPTGCAAGFVGPWPLVRPMAYTWAPRFY